jgi:microcin C transport system substrate-binding protein
MGMMAPPPHIPVLIGPLIAAVAPVRGVWVDGTFGAGGYARALLEAGAERVIGIMRHNMKKLGIASTFRYVDASQYQKRLEGKQFDIVSMWWNQGLFYPSTEQYLYWHSSQADIPGGQNLSGARSPALDLLTEKIQNAQTLEQLRPAARALDRVLQHEHYVIPHWNINAWRLVYWDQFGRPDITPLYNIGIETWWDKQVVSHQSLVTGKNSDSNTSRSSSPKTGDRGLETNP